MYSLAHLRRVQDYILRNPDVQMIVFHSPFSPQPDLLGDLTFRSSQYVQKGSILVLDADGASDVVHLLSSGQHALFHDDQPADYWPVHGDDLRGLAAREDLA